MSRAEALSLFLNALDEWDCTDNEERAKAIIEFIDGGCDLSQWEDRPRLVLVKSEPPPPYPRQGVSE